MRDACHISWPKDGFLYENHQIASLCLSLTGEGFPVRMRPTKRAVPCDVLLEAVSGCDSFGQAVLGLQVGICVSKGSFFSRIIVLIYGVP
jgi:hypothetical protein